MDPIDQLVESIKGKSADEIRALIEASDQAPAVEDPPLLAVYLEALAAA